MNNKHSLQSFLSDIDRILDGELIAPFEGADCSHEYKELLFIAQMLAQADYTPGNQDQAKKMIADIKAQGELEDDELDLVAGGVNMNNMVDKKGKKKCLGDFDL